MHRSFSAFAVEQPRSPKRYGGRTDEARVEESAMDVGMGLGSQAGVRRTSRHRRPHKTSKRYIPGVRNTAPARGQVYHLPQSEEADWLAEREGTLVLNKGVPSTRAPNLIGFDTNSLKEQDARHFTNPPWRKSMAPQTRDHPLLPHAMS